MYGAGLINPSFNYTPLKEQCTLDITIKQMPMVLASIAPSS